MRAPAPPSDPYEPNDDIRWISGRSGFEADAPFLRTAVRAAVRARIDVQKDPVDVYPVWVPAGGSVSVRLTPHAMAADLFVWPPDRPHGPRQGRHRQEQAARRWRARR